MLVSLPDYFCVHKKFLVYSLTSRNLKIKYKGSFFGYFWSLMVPLAQAFIYYCVFKLILKVSIPNYVSYILSGVLMWGYFSNTLGFGIEGLTANRQLLTKIPIPLQVFPLVESISNGMTLLLASPILLAVVIYTGAQPGWSFLLFFYYVAVVGLIAFGLSTVLGLLSVFFADVKHVFSLVVQLWMYATPIFYHEEMIPEAWRWVVAVNPVGYAFTGMRQAVVLGEFPGAEKILIPLAWGILSVLVGWFATNMAKRRGVIEVL